MSFDESFLAPDAQRYVARIPALPFPVLARIEEEAAREHQPAVGRGTGSILRALAAATNAGRGARRILEVGTNIGYSGLWLASGLASEGRLDTIEIDPKTAARAREHFAEAGLGVGAVTRARVHEGAALDVLPSIEPAYDVVFLDALKDEYPAYLDHALRLTKPGAVIAADNAFWLGAAWDDKAEDEQTRGVREYTRRVTSDARLATMLVPSEDGLLVSFVRSTG